MTAPRRLNNYINPSRPPSSRRFTIFPSNFLISLINSALFFFFFSFPLLNRRSQPYLPRLPSLSAFGPILSPLTLVVYDRSSIPRSAPSLVTQGLHYRTVPAVGGPMEKHPHVDNRKFCLAVREIHYAYVRPEILTTRAVSPCEVLPSGRAELNSAAARRSQAAASKDSWPHWPVRPP
jgi:hypothetical protein